jgi:hypothetical protein
MAMLAGIRAASEDVRSAGHLLAVDVFGPMYLSKFPDAANIMALGIASRGHVIVFQLEEPVIDFVYKTTISSVGWTRPPLLESHWVIEPHPAAARFESRPSNPTIGLGGASAGNKDVLVAFREQPPHLSDGYATSAKDLEGTRLEGSAAPTSFDAVGWSRQVARFAIVFGALLESKNAPMKAAVREYEAARADGAPSPMVHEARFSLQPDGFATLGELVWRPDERQWRYDVRRK